MFGIFSCRKFRPINRSPKPIINSPQLLRIRFAEKSSGRLNPIRGRERLTILILNPRMEINHAVNVVPTLAPMMTPIEPIRSSKPALTKLTTITVVAEELWMMGVINKPVITPFTRLDVIAARMVLILLPATFCKASLIIFIPKRNTPNDPINCKKSRIV